MPLCTTTSLPVSPSPLPPPGKGAAAADNLVQLSGLNLGETKLSGSILNENNPFTYSVAVSATTQCDELFSPDGHSTTGLAPTLMLKVEQQRGFQQEVAFVAAWFLVALVLLLAEVGGGSTRELGWEGGGRVGKGGRGVVQSEGRGCASIGGKYFGRRMRAGVGGRGVAQLVLAVVVLSGTWQGTTGALSELAEKCWNLYTYDEAVCGGDGLQSCWDASNENVFVCAEFVSCGVQCTAGGECTASTCCNVVIPKLDPLKITKICGTTDTGSEPNQCSASELAAGTCSVCTQGK